MSGDLAGHARHMRRCIDAVTGQVGSASYPLAAAVVRDDEVLSLCVSALPQRPDPSAHPEMEAVRAAAAALRSRYLPGAVLYSTLEPCPMCTSVVVWGKMAGIVFGASQEDALLRAARADGGALTWRQIRLSAATVAAAGDPVPYVLGGVLRDECLSLLDLSADRSEPGAQDGRS